MVASPIRSGNRKRHKVRIVGECLSPFPNPATCHGVMKTLSKHPCGTKPRHLLELESAYARTLRLHKALRARESVKKKGKALCIERKSLVQECLQELFALEVMPKFITFLLFNI